MTHKKFRYAFIIQAEGRGHMTQAMTLYDILIKNGHEVCCVFIGKSERRMIPSYFTDKVKAPVLAIDSPNFITDMDNKSIKIFKTITHNLKLFRKYLKSLRFIHNHLKSHQPDAMINFYDILGGLYFRFYTTKTRHICIGHQFLADHPDFPFAPNRPLDKRLFQNNNMLTSMNAYKKLALSFRPYFPERHKKAVVVPPLLRDDIKKLQPENKNFILGYMVNDGYGDDIIQWHKSHTDIEVHCFWDRKGYPEVYQPHENIYFHQLSGEKFVEKMRTCQGYVSTAGFESICEAMYLGKPVMMIPVDGQYEQSCNAIDAEKSGAGIHNDTFNIQRLIDYIPLYKPVIHEFKSWVDQAEARFLKELTSL